MTDQAKYHSLTSENQNYKYLTLVFLFWPLLAFVMACSNINNKINQKIILAFFVVYGALFFINPVMDSQRRADTLKEVHQEPFENLFNTFSHLYEETLDFVEPVLMYTVSRFTDFHGVLFALYGLIFGSLMLYYLRKMYGHYLSKRNRNALLFFLFLICVNPIYNIGGFRMWAAAWMFAVGVLNYLHKPNYKAIIVASISFLIHFSFLPAVIVLIGYVFLKNRPKVYGIVAIISFFIVELNIQQIRQYAALLGAASETKITSYTNEEYIENLNELSNQTAWYIESIENAVKYLTLFSLLIIFIKTKARFKKQLSANFFSFSLLFLSFANLSALLPSGNRFYTVFYTFAFSAVLLYFSYEQKEEKLITLNKFALPILVMFMILTFRLFSATASIYILGPSFFMPYGLIENISLQSILF
jgi:hypothetical protein